MKLILLTGSEIVLKPNDEISVKVAISDMAWTREVANWMQYMEQIPPEDRTSSILIGRRYFHVPPGHDGSPMIKELDRPEYFQRIAANRVKIRPGFCGTYPLIAESKTLNLKEDINIVGTLSSAKFTRLWWAEQHKTLQKMNGAILNFALHMNLSNAIKYVKKLGSSH